MATEPLLELGDNTELDENSNGEPVLRHKPSGAEFKFDSANGNWKPTADIDMGGQAIRGAGSVSTEEAVTKSLSFDYSDRYPQFPTRPAANGVPMLRPVGGISQPILDESDVSTGGGLADPFIVYDRERSTFDLFYEQFDSGEQHVGHATSTNGIDWSHNQTVMDLVDGFDEYAYPHVFKWQDQWYMTPAAGGGSFNIFQADGYPTSWSHAEQPLNPSWTLGDPTPIWFNGRWYLFVHDLTNNQIRFFYADSGEDFLGRSWTEHADSGILSGSSYDTMGGRPLVGDDEILLFVRKSNNSLSAYRVTDLTPSSFSGDFFSGAGSIIGGNDNPNDPRQGGMHHVDIIDCEATSQPLAVVDATSDGPPSNNWAIMLYTIGEPIAPKHRGDISSDQTISTAGTGGWQSIDISPGYDFGQRLSGPHIFVRQTGYFEARARVALTNFSATGFTVDLRLQDTSLGVTLHEESHEVNQAVDQTLPFYHEEYIWKNRKIEFQVQQNSGSGVDLDSTKTHCYLEKRHG